LYTFKTKIPNKILSESKHLLNLQMLMLSN